jgi:DNA integrity scanning protein DisA with diadenylate cyclase activity
VVDALVRGQTGSPTAILAGQLAELEQRNEIDTLIRHTGQLTGIDGALVVREDLTIIGFGAKLRFGVQDLRARRYDLFSNQDRDAVPISELGGMRHQSAARYVAEHHDCSAVVVSQDGSVTLFAWETPQDAVVAVHGLEHCAAAAFG